MDKLLPKPECRFYLDGMTLNKLLTEKQSTETPFSLVNLDSLKHLLILKDEWNKIQATATKI